MEDKRHLPRHVDGRIMIGRIYYVNFFKMLPIVLIILFITFKFFSPISLFLGVILSSITVFAFSEINNKETAFDLFVSLIKQAIKGDFVLERRPIDAPIHKRFINNEKVKEVYSKRRNTISTNN